MGYIPGITHECESHHFCARWVGMDILNHFIKINLTFCVACESKFSIWHHLHLSMLPICIALITDRGAKHMLRSLRDFPPAIRGNNKPNFTLKNKLGKAQGEELYLFVFKWHFSALMKLEASRIKGCYFSNLSFLVSSVLLPQINLSMACWRMSQFLKSIWRLEERGG